MKEFDNVLQRQRKHLNYSLSVAAEKIGCTKPHLWELEHNKTRNPTAKILNGMRREYGLTADFLLDLFNADVVV